MIAFVILAAVMVIGAVGVVTLRQPVHAALSLVGTLMALAVTYVTLEAHFLAAIQVIVYAGAIMVLFLFVIMLLNVQGNLPSTRFRWMKPMAYGAAALVAVGAAVTVIATRVPLAPEATITGVLQGGNAGSIGEMLFSDYLLAFHLVGVLLLTGIVAAVSLVQRAAPETRPQVAVGARAGRAPDREGAGAGPLLPGAEPAVHDARAAEPVEEGR
ncbi:MAG: NADH-quinone oxidoreductase subunit J [Trueperaceae bacterium]